LRSIGWFSSHRAIASLSAADGELFYLTLLCSAISVVVSQAEQVHMHVRPARPGEAEQISALCFRSKAHWGYDAAFMAHSLESLTVSADQIAAGDVWVAEVDGVVLGMVALAKLEEPGLVDLDKLFVEPAHLRSGAGRALMDFAIVEARRRGYARMAILADPNAAAFYARMGAVYLREKASDAIPGRVLPYFEITL
jgi:predicted N-acetyltransferase YhbS